MSGGCQSYSASQPDNSRPLHIQGKEASMILSRAARVISALLPLVVAITPQPAIAGVKRIASIPEPLLGAWAPNADACKDPAKLAVVLSAHSYTSSQASCEFRDISETSGPNGAIYSARSQCTQPGQASPTQSNVILRLEDLNRMSIGPDFENLKIHQKCDASTPAPQIIAAKQTASDTPISKRFIICPRCFECACPRRRYR